MNCQTFRLRLSDYHTVRLSDCPLGHLEGPCSPARTMTLDPGSHLPANPCFFLLRLEFLGRDVAGPVFLFFGFGMLVWVRVFLVWIFALAILWVHLSGAHYQTVSLSDSGCQPLRISDCHTVRLPDAQAVTLTGEWRRKSAPREDRTPDLEVNSLTL